MGWAARVELVPRFIDQGYGDAEIAARRQWVERRTATPLLHVAGAPLRGEALRGNVENPIGVAQVPLGLAGPLAILGEHAHGIFYVPLATTEGALVRSYERGMVALTRAGGATARLYLDENRVTPLFSLDSVAAARSFALQIEEHVAAIRAAAEATTRHGRLLRLECEPIGRDVLVRFCYSTGDAHGMNMIVRATEAACAWILQNTAARRCLLLSGAESEKHASGALLAGGKGKKVVAGARLPAALVRSYLHVGPAELVDLWQRTVLGHLQAGALGYNGHFANGLAALFIACGQDVANLANSAVGITHFEMAGDDLYASVTLPSLTVATVGGGTALGTAGECLALLGCAGTGGSPRLAEIVAAVLLAGELSMGAAIASGEFVAAHESYGRNRPSLVRRSPRGAGGALELPVARLVLYAAPDALTAALERELGASRSVRLTRVVSSPAALAEAGREGPGLDLVVYRPAYRGARDGRPDLDQAAAALEVCAQTGAARLILISSAACCQPLHTHPGFLREDRCKAASNPIALAWQELERRCARRCAEAGVELSVLRPAAVVSSDGIDYFSRLLRGRLAPTLAGHDPCLQLLSPADLAAALRSLVERPASGVYQVAPAGVIPLSAALRLAGVRRLPIGYTVQRLARRVTAALGLSFPAAQLAYIRYAATVSGARIERELGFVPGRSSAGAIRDLVEAGGLADAPGRRPPGRTTAPDRYDDFGMDAGYIAALGRTLFHFLHRYYWRVEVRGLEHVPAEGGAVLAGIHRGFMPFDGVMALHALARQRRRIPRFLVHPSLLKPPFLSRFISRLGGIPACRENADRVLGAGELLGMFPEGIQGAFTLYRNAYRLGRFGRDEYVKMALRNGVPIIPFVTVGSAEIFPILGKVEWRWWQRLSEWPFLPLTPTFPLLPLPLPSKWHTRFLPPLEVQRLHPPAAAADSAVVRALSREVRRRMEAAIGEMLARRRSIFFGSVFEPAAAGGEAPGEAR